MTQVAQVQIFEAAEVTYLPQTLVAEAEKLLCEIRPLDLQTLNLATLCHYHQRLGDLIKELEKVKGFARRVLPELKPRFHAFNIYIQKQQNPTT